MTLNRLKPSDIYTLTSSKFESSPYIVMIHGLHSNHKTFINCLDFFSNFYNCLIYDQRGHGQTIRLGDDYSVETMARDLKDLLDHLNIKKIHLLGHSMGGRTAAAFCGLFPEYVYSIIIEDIGLGQRSNYSQSALEQVHQRSKQLYRETNLFSSHEEARKYLTQISLPESMIDRKITKLSENTFQTEFFLDSTLLYGYQGNMTDLTHYLQNCPRIPKLFLRADVKIGSALKDDCIKNIERNLENYKTVDFKDAHHSIHSCKFDEFNDVVLKFLKEIH